MIQDILLPEKIGSYYLFGKRVVGIEITGTHIYATVAYVKGSSTRIEQCLEAEINQQSGDTHQARTSSALKKVLTAVGKFHEIRFALSGMHVVFKTLQLPFAEPIKIKKVIDFEAEPLLPFAISDAIIDFVITKTNNEQYTSQVLLAAVPKPYLIQQLELFIAADTAPTTVTIDAFELYGMFMQIYPKHEGNAVLVDVNSDTTKILFISDDQLRFVRPVSLPLDFTKPADRTEQPATMEEPFAGAQILAQNILFTVQSITVQTRREETPTVYLLGTGAQVPNFSVWLEQELSMPCVIFNPMNIGELAHITINRGTTIDVAHAVSTATALTSPITADINILQKEFAPNTESLLLKQLLCGAVLLILTLAGLLTHSYLQKRALHNELAASRAETEAILIEHFPDIEKGPISEMLESAEEENKKNEQTWFAFKRSAHNSLLNLLLQLTRMNREGMDLIIERIIIDQEHGIVTLKAQVKDHDALVRLERELKQSNLFSYIQPQNNTNFTMELYLKTDREGNA